MKFQSIIHYLILIVVVRNGDAPQQMTGKLSKEKNDQRLATCGKEVLARSSAQVPHEPSWLLWAMTKNPHKDSSDTGVSLATFISCRHVLTSSQVVLYDNKTHIPVPDEVLAQISLYYVDCLRKNPPNCEPLRFQLKQAYILNYCRINKGDWALGQALMVVDIGMDFKMSPPCLEDETTDVVKGNREMNVYTLKGGGVMYNKLPILDKKEDLIVFDQYNSIGDRGGPVMKRVNSKETLIGLSMQSINEKFSVAWRVSFSDWDLCGVVGVCSRAELGPDPPLPPSTPTTELIPKEQLTTPLKTPEAPPPPPTSPPEPSTEAPPTRAAPPARRREDDDTDDEMYLKRKKEKEEAAMYEDEDTDILISKDDLNDCDGRRGGLQSIFLCLFVFYWFLCE
ncbi:hypothetical protein GCK72_003342 [Caenorhabditis remanei]|uniref:Peptidase S1 domain-containing protein n=1 Tax=Caenorhabditis remanei TaxID=31234 RepID=A0A6A5HV47_CAERE|nr:hypothetical protein GCK72_003342 [Caenorhabditis remanei]KAF1771515.1 hypothetical protein GCK72_003342 [Caenorhabditis remanei]